MTMTVNIGGGSIFSGRAWEVLSSKINEDLQYNLGKLETCKPEELVGIQEVIKVLRGLLNLPATYKPNKEDDIF